MTDKFGSRLLWCVSMSLVEHRGTFTLLIDTVTKSLYLVVYRPETVRPPDCHPRLPLLTGPFR